MKTEAVFLVLVRAVVCGASIDEDVRAACTPEMIGKVYALALRHDLAHLVGQALSKLNLPDSEQLSKCKNTAWQALTRCAQLEYECERAYAVLEEARIAFIPLKGAVLRAYYPESWMRTSCDVDILVKEENLDTAIRVLEDTLAYRSRPKTDHDITMISPSGIHLELHYDTIQERYEINGCRRVLSTIWDTAIRDSADSCRFHMTDEMFYFYHMAHMTKHFDVGGCGVRSFLDIWILNHCVKHSEETRHALLTEGGLSKFALAAERVAEYWFSCETPDQMTSAVSDYILRAGLYGDEKNRAALGKAKMGGGVRYVLLRRIFMPYEFLKAEYPILNTKKWLFPFYQVVRWSRMLPRGGWRSALRELKANVAVSEEQAETAADIVKYLGL